MNPAFMDNMSWEMAEVYGAVTDQILINLAKYFRYYKPGEAVPKSSFEYQARMLAQMGQVNAETVRIIRNGLGGADEALKKTLEQAIIDAVSKAEPELLDAVKRGIFSPAGVPIVAPQQMRAFQLYYQQAADKLNLVNTVMLESTRSAYQQTITDVMADIDLSERMAATYTALDVAAGETITGVSSWNEALRHATQRMTDRGIVGFVDHAGRRWSAEAYAAMDIRTTVFGTGRAAVWETNQNFGNDLYQVSYHNGARPLCYPWQNKVISSMDAARTVQDLDGNSVEVIAQSATSYGKPAGLFGINCRHYPTPFIPGVSIIRGQPQNQADNDRVYEQSQQQRGLERKIREQRRDLLMMRAQGAPDDMIRAQKAKIRQTDDEIDEFCKETGRARRQNREGVFTKREFPDADRYDVGLFEREQQERLKQYYQAGGAQQGYSFGQMTPKTPIVPPAPPAPPAAPPAAAVAQNVASQATQPAYDRDMFKDVKGVTDTFRQGMADTLLASGNDTAIRLYGKYADQLVCTNPSARTYTAFYSSMRGGVTMNLANVAAGSSYETPFEVAFHEFGHMIDDISNPGKPYYLSNTELNGKRLLDVIKDDYKAFKKAMGARTNDDLIILLKDERMDERTRGNISDILEKCTNRSYPLGLGHGVSYHKRDGATEREFFAEVLDSSVANQASYDQMKRLFPNAVKMVWELIKGVI